MALRSLVRVAPMRYDPIKKKVEPSRYSGYLSIVTRV